MITPLTQRRVANLRHTARTTWIQLEHLEVDAQVLRFRSQRPMPLPEWRAVQKRQAAIERDARRMARRLAAAEASLRRAAMPRWQRRWG